MNFRYYENKTKSLNIGDMIGVTATSDGFISEPDLVRLENGIKHFEELGYPVVITENVKKSNKGRSSAAEVRAKELAQLFCKPEISAVIAASGGDYLVEMLPWVDFDSIIDNPKWVQGFSDTTGLTFTITTNLDIATLYTNNFSTFGMEHWHPSLFTNLRILEGQEIVQHSFDYYQDGYQPRITGLEEFYLEKEVRWTNLYPKGWDTEKELTITGRALGGCLDVLLNLVGTRFDKMKEFIHKYQSDSILWFLESYNLSSEALIRGLWQLKEAGWFEHASGFVFGRPAMYSSDTDTSYEEAISSILGDLNLPIILEADIGHKPPQMTMMSGAIAQIRSFAGKGSVIFERK
jgi:muramoyltetrapeptide carboxypeptidase LdcA involved in peptidoglycan recycling